MKETTEDSILYAARALGWMWLGVAATFLALALAGVPLPPCNSAVGSAAITGPPRPESRAPVALESKRAENARQTVKDEGLVTNLHTSARILFDAIRQVESRREELSIFDCRLPIEKTKRADQAYGGYENRAVAGRKTTATSDRWRTQASSLNPAFVSPVQWRTNANESVRGRQQSAIGLP